jgi:hypothetical protein
MMLHDAPYSIVKIVATLSFLDLPEAAGVFLRLTKGATDDWESNGERLRRTIQNSLHVHQRLSGVTVDPDRC